MTLNVEEPLPGLWTTPRSKLVARVPFRFFLPLQIFVSLRLFSFFQTALLLYSSFLVDDFELKGFGTALRSTWLPWAANSAPRGGPGREGTPGAEPRSGSRQGFSGPGLRIHPVASGGAVGGGGGRDEVGGRHLPISWVIPASTLAPVEEGAS